MAAEKIVWDGSPSQTIFYFTPAVRYADAARLSLRGAPTGRKLEGKTSPRCGGKGNNYVKPDVSKTAAVEFPIVCHYVPNNVEIHVAPQAAKRRRNPQCGIISTKKAAQRTVFVKIHFAACEAAKAANRARQPLHE